MRMATPRIVGRSRRSGPTRCGAQARTYSPRCAHRLRRTWRRPSAARLAWQGVTHSPSFVGEPQCNGVIERFMRTLKEQCLRLHRLDTLDEARAIVSTFIARDNAEWLIERLGHRTPRGGASGAARGRGVIRLARAPETERLCCQRHAPTSVSRGDGRFATRLGRTRQQREAARRAPCGAYKIPSRLRCVGAE
jgi:hypothetical protein